MLISIFEQKSVRTKLLDLADQISKLPPKDLTGLTSPPNTDEPNSMYQ